MPSFTTSDIFIFVIYSTNSSFEPNSASCVSPVTLFFRVTFFLAPWPNIPSKLKFLSPIPFLVIFTFTFERAFSVPDAFSSVFSPSSGVACTRSSPIFSPTSSAGSSLSVGSSIFSSTVFSCDLSFPSCSFSSLRSVSSNLSSVCSLLFDSRLASCFLSSTLTFIVTSVVDSSANFISTVASCDSALLVSACFFTVTLASDGRFVIADE